MLHDANNPSQHVHNMPSTIIPVGQSPQHFGCKNRVHAYNTQREIVVNACPNMHQYQIITS